MPRYNSMEYGNLDFPILPNKILPTYILLKLSFRKFMVCIVDGNFLQEAALHEFDSSSHLTLKYTSSKDK